jgi:FSR family fosmidomycin resistance protein-like MFS transporter
MTAAHTGPGETAPPAAAPNRFDLGGVMTVSTLHFTHDVFGAFIGTLLPVLQERLQIPIGQAGLLASAFRLPSVLQPFLGYWADKYDARLFVVWAPTVTAIAVTSLGWAPTYLAMVVVLMIAGLSSAAFHPAAGAMVTRVGGDRIGRASAYFMTGGELGRAVGPALIAAYISYVAFEQIWVLLIPAVVVTAFGFQRIVGSNARIPKPPPAAALRAAIAARRGPLALMTAIILMRSLTLAGFQTYLPSLIVNEGHGDLRLGGLTLTIYEIGGVVGAFTGGTLSDRFGRRQLMLVSQITGGPILFAALWFVGGLASYPLLVIGGFLALSAGGVQLALMQELLPGNRSVAAGLTYFLSFESAVITTAILGFAAEWWGLGNALMAGVVVSMFSIPFTLLLPETRGATAGGH